MADYVASLQDVIQIRKADKEKDLTKPEIKEYRKVTGKLSWLANSTQLDLSFTVLAMSKKINSAKIASAIPIREISLRRCLPAVHFQRIQILKFHNKDGKLMRERCILSDS